MLDMTDVTQPRDPMMPQCHTCSQVQTPPAHRAISPTAPFLRHFLPNLSLFILLCTVPCDPNTCICTSRAYHLTFIISQRLCHTCEICELLSASAG